MKIDPDLTLIFGLILLVFSIPSIMSSFSERRAPRIATIVLMIGGLMVIWAVQAKPGGYTIEQLPEVFISVVRRFL